MVADTLGVPLELKEINVLTGENKTSEFTKLNSQQQVPVLVDDDLVLPERYVLNLRSIQNIYLLSVISDFFCSSRAIIEYLCDVYGKDDSLFPKNPKTRAKINARLYFDCGTLCPKLYTAYVSFLMRDVHCQN